MEIGGNGVERPLPRNASKEGSLTQYPCRAPRGLLTRHRRPGLLALLIELVLVPAITENFGLDDAIRFWRLALVVGRTMLQVPENFDSLDDTSECRMHAVQMRRWDKSEEELGIARISAGIRHAQRESKMAAVVGTVALAL